MKVKILDAQYLMMMYNIPEYGNVHKAHRIKYIISKPYEIQYELVLCTINKPEIDKPEVHL